MSDEYAYSANYPLHHFCAILRGNVGFKVATERMHEVKDREGLDEPAVEYMAEVLNLLPKFGKFGGSSLHHWPTNLQRNAFQPR